MRLRNGSRGRRTHAPRLDRDRHQSDRNPRHSPPPHPRPRSLRCPRPPETEAALKELKYLEFQNWVIDDLGGTHAPRPTGDLGIDGYSFFERLPIQVKQQERVGREVVDLFETAVRRDGSHKGYIVAFSFGKGAWDEANRAKVEGLEIELVTIATLLNNPPEDDEPPDETLPDLVQDLLNRAKQARRTHARREPPRRTIEELALSAGVG